MPWATSRRPIRAGRLGGRSRPARLRAAGRAARQPVPLPHPAFPLGCAHARQRALRVPDPGHGRARGPELGPRARVRDLRHGANRRAHGRARRIGLIPAGVFRAVRRPVYLGLCRGARAAARLAGPRGAGQSGDVPIPTSGQAGCSSGAIDFEAAALPARPPPRPASTTRSWCRSRSARPARLTSSSSKGPSTSR